MKTVVKLQTQEQSNEFFALTGYPMPSCGCTRTNWDYKKYTAYNISDVEFGNVNYYRAIQNRGIDELSIISFEQFMMNWKNNVINIKELELCN